MADKCLRNGTVDTIVRHVVGIVCCPSQCEFGKVASSYHKTIHLVCHIHEDLCAFASLSVLVCNIVLIDVVLNVLEMLEACLAYTDFAKRDAQALHKCHSIMIGAVGGSETRHGNTYNICTWTRELVHGTNADEKGKGGVEATADTNHYGLRMCMDNALCKGIHLDGKDFLASFIEFLACWNEWMWIHPSSQFIV